MAGQLLLESGGTRPPVRLLPLTQAGKIQWDHARRALKPLGDDEASAFERLVVASRETAVNEESVVTGPLTRTDAVHVLHVRLFQPARP